LRIVRSDDAKLTSSVDCSEPSWREDRLVLTALPRVYSAALAASGDAGVAEMVAERVLIGDPRGDVGALVERAVLLAVRTSPHDAFAPMRVEEVEVVALARLAGATTTRVAALLNMNPAAVRALMTSGLRALLTRDGARRTPPPPRGCGSAASPGRGARVS
jgi:hypothetical protein